MAILIPDQNGNTERMEFERENSKAALNCQLAYYAGTFIGTLSTLETDFALREELRHRGFDAQDLEALKNSLRKLAETFYR